MPANQRLVKNRIALVLRGVCGFIVKVKNAQNAGAGRDRRSTMSPAARPWALAVPSRHHDSVDTRLLADGITLFNAMNFDVSSGRSINEKVRFFTDPSQLAGADALDHVMIFTPNPLQPGSSGFSLGYKRNP